MPINELLQELMFEYRVRVAYGSGWIAYQAISACPICKRDQHRHRDIEKMSSDFYSGLAATAQADFSDVSAADTSEVAKNLDDLDDLDAALFGSKKTVQPPAKKTMSDKKSSLDLGFDIDDPLAGLLSDEEEEDEIPKKTGLVKRTAEKDKKKDDDDDAQSPTSSRRLEIERPPTRSGKTSPEPSIEEKRKEAPPAAKRGQDDILFDEDDIVDMGLDSPGRRTSTPASLDDGSSRRGGQSKSIMDDLLGKDSISKHFIAPSGNTSTEFVLDKKYTKSAAKPKSETKDDDEYLFGSYMPSASAAGGATGSRPSSTRSVRFENDKADNCPTTPSRPTSSGRHHGDTSAASRLDKFMSSDNDDWLDMASGSTARKKEPTRPSSEGNVNEKTEKPGTAHYAISESVDWLGLSRLGSPDYVKSETSKPANETINASDINTTIANNNDDDWLGVGKAKRARSVPARQADDWLSSTDIGGSTGKADQLDDWLTSKTMTSMGHGDETDLSVKTPVIRSAKTDDLFSTSNIHEQISPIKPDTRSEGRPAEKTTMRQEERSVDAKRIEALIESPLDLDTSAAAAPIAITAMVSPYQQMLKQQQQSAAMQQQVLMKQQQEEMVALEQQMGMQQAAMRKQQQQQMLAMQQQQLQQQQQQLDAVAKKAASKQLFTSLSLPSGSPTDGSTCSEHLLKINTLEMQNSHLLAMLETTKQHHLEETKVIDESYRKRITLLEETFQRRESRLRDETEMLSQQSVEKMRMLEQDKTDLMMAQIQRQDDWERERQREIERVQQLHRDAISAMHIEQKETVERLQRVRDQEVDAISSSHTHTRSLNAVIEKIAVNARGLDELQDRVGNQHGSWMDQRDHVANERDQALNKLQERLERQQHSNDLERARLEALITKLELQLTDQTRELEQERWKVKQEESKLRTLQNCLDQEKSLMAEQNQHDKTQLEKSKDNLLEEQQNIMGQLFRERQALAEEKAKFELAQKLHIDKMQRESLKNLKMDADLGSNAKVINDERSRLQAATDAQEKEKVNLAIEKRTLDQDKQALVTERTRLKQLAINVNQSSKEIASMSVSAAASQEKGERALQSARQIEAKHAAQTHKIQTQLDSLHTQEKKLVQSKLELDRYRQSMEEDHDKMLCVSCRTPVRDGYPTQIIQGSPKGRAYISPNPPQQAGLQSYGSVQSAIEQDHSVRMWRIAARKDQDFLEQETCFLEILKHSPYHSAQTS